MYNLVQLRSFVEAVKGGSLSAGARRLKLTQPAVSQHIRALELRSGKNLLVRMKGGIRPTDAGDVMFHHAQIVLSELAQMDDQLNALNGIASGDFKFTTSETMSQTAAVEVITRLRKAAPDLNVELITADAFLDVDAEQINLALRVGQAGKGGGIVQRIGDITGVLVAAPAYLDHMGRPSDVSELNKLDYLQYREGPDQAELPLIAPDGRPIIAPVTPAFAAHSPSLMLHALQQGLGFAQVPFFATQHLIDKGTLEVVLPGYTGQSKPLYIVQPESKRNSLANKVARAVLFDVLAIMPGVLLRENAKMTHQVS